MYEVRIEQEDGGLLEEENGFGGEDSSSMAPTGKTFTFVVMNSVFPAEANKFIAERFDLKGSTVGREVSEEELRSKGSNSVLKDLDLARDVAPYFRVEENRSTAIIAEVKTAVKQWRGIAKKYGISNTECDVMERAFGNSG